MKIVFAPDSFKNSLSAAQVSRIIREKAEEIFPGCEMQEIPLADGDKGTMYTLISVLGGRYDILETIDCMGKKKKMVYGVLDKETVVIEAGQLLREGEISEYSIRQQLLFSSSEGVGKAICKLLDLGFRKIYIGAGNGVTYDGGMGCATAMGVRFFDKKGQNLKPAGISLLEIDSIDTNNLDPRIKDAEITVMCSVNNPLFGEQGAAYVYGAYSGGGPDELLQLERGMRNYAEIIKKTKGIDLKNITGAGAAGGLPVALKVFLGAKLQSGISTVLYLIRFEELIENASLVVVGEGTLDKTSIYGKAMTGIGMLCKARGIPVVALVGKVDKDAELLYNFGISSIMSSVDNVMGEDEAIENIEKLVESAAERMFRFLAVGSQIQSREDVIFSAGVELRQKKTNNRMIHWAVDPDWEE